MITVQPILYTSDPESWHRFAVSLGFTPAFPPVPVWSEFEAGGILAIHQVAAGDPKAGEADLHLLVSDLDAVERAATTAGAEVRRSTPDDVGRMLTIVAGDLLLTVSAGHRRRLGDPSVLPIRYVRDVVAPDQLYRALGLRSRIAAVGAVWADYTGDGGGLAALHEGEPRTELSFEYAANLDDLASRLNQDGYAAEIVDEAYNRTLRVVGPDALELWVNGVQQDLYGYTSLG